MAIFKKLNIGDVVASSGTRSFKKLTTELPIWNGTDLTGTTWYIPAGWTAEAEYGLFESQGYMQIDGEGSQINFRRLRIGYTPNDTSGYAPEPNSIVAVTFAYNFKLIPTKMYKFSFSGGTDVTNPRLIDWLLKNAELTSHQPAHKGGLYDADDNLVASWNALAYAYGMDVEKDYASSTYATDPASPYCVLTNNPELSTGTKMVIGSDVIKMGTYSFYNCTNLTSITFIDGVTSIGNFAFEGCTSLTSIAIPPSITRIGCNAFEDCTNLIDVHITDIVSWCGIVFLSNSGFGSNKYNSNPLAYASRLYLNGELVADLKIPNGLTSIGAAAFYGYKGLTSITIPPSIKAIGRLAFEGCTNIAEVHITDIAVWCGITFTIHSATAHSHTSNPLAYASRLYLNGELVTDLVLPNSVTSLGTGIFYGYKDLTRIVVHGGITTIGEHVFSGCASSADVVLLDGVTTIGYNAFYSCKFIKSIVIPTSVTTIGNYAFASCSSLKDVYYRGTQEQWNAIDVDPNYNGYLCNTATKHFNYTD